MANKMEVIKRWFGESPEPRIVGIIEGASINILRAGQENESMLLAFATALDVKNPSSMHLETLIARIVLEVERAFRAEEQRTYAKEAK